MRRSRAGRLGLSALCAVAALVWTLPFLVLLQSALRPLKEIRAGWWHLREATFTLENFAAAWQEGMSRTFLNSLQIAVGATLTALVAGSLAAFALTKLRFAGRGAVYAGFLATMLLPLQLILIPLFPWLIKLRLNDSLLGVILVHGAFGMGWTLFHLSNFFRSIPDELLESARVDGASDLYIFRRIVLPLSVPALVSYAVLQFIWVWNDLLVALTLIQTPDKYPVTVGLVNLQSPHYPRWDIQAAGAVLSILPPILLFLAVQRYYAKELFAGAVRG